MYAKIPNDVAREVFVTRLPQLHPDPTFYYGKGVS